MSGHVRDRWMRRDPATGRKVRTERHGKGLRWQGVVVRADGRRTTQGFATEADAKLWVIKAQTTPQLVAPAVAFETAARAWLDGHAGLRASSRTTTRQKLDTMILPAIGALDLAEISRATLQQMVAGWVEAGYSPSTMRTAWSHVVSVLTDAKLDKLIAELPTEGVKLPSRPPRRVVPLTDEQVATMMAVMPRNLRAMVLLGATSGLRPAELAGLTWDRIEGTTITVDRQLITTRSADELDLGPLKTASSYRDVGVGRDVVVELEEHRRIFGEGEEGLVFRAPMGGLMTRHLRSETWSRYRHHIGGVAGDGWHQLRHHHASKLLSAGVSVVPVAHRLGHKDATETLQTYAHLMPGDEGRMVAVAAASALQLLDVAGTLSGR